MELADNIDYLCEDYSSNLYELEKLSASDLVKIQINEGLEEALKELDVLHNQFSAKDSENLLDLCKTTVIESITGQFGLASMFIAAKDGGSVTTKHNFEKGVTATDADKQKYENFKSNNDGSRSWETVRQSGGYDDGFSQKRKTAFQTQEVVTDAYTGKPLPKDGRAHIDHIVSAKEIEGSAANHLFLTPEQRAKMATSDKNLAWTEASANMSKGDRPMKEWLDKQKNGETNDKRFGIDREKALQQDAEARKYIKQEITIAAVKKQGLELMATGGKDAAMMVASTGIGVILRDLVQAVFEEIHITFRQRGQESLKEIFVRFKERMSAVLAELKEKWKDILAGSIGAGITAFLSNIVVFVINQFATTLKKLVTIIRAGFVSLCEAIKILANPPAGMDSEEVNFQALKILTAGLIGAASLGLSAGIEKLLQSILALQPIMMFPIPFTGQEEPRTVSDILTSILTALAGGLLTTIALYFMDKARAAGKKDKLQIQLVAQSGLVVQYKISQTWIVMNDAYYYLHNSIEEGIQLCIQTKQELDNINKKTNEAVDGLRQAVDKLRSKQVQTGERSLT